MDSTNQRRQALIQDRDRRSLELTGIRRAALLASRARRASISAIRRGESPVAAMKNELLGDPRINPDGLVALVRDGMMAAHLKGRQRTLINAAPQFRATGGYKLAGTAYDDALNFLQERLKTPEFILEDLQRQYGPAAARMTDQIASTLEYRMNQAMLDLTRQGAGVRDAIKAMQQVYRTEGMAPEANYRLETMFRTQTQIAYSAGRENSLDDDAVQEILWGFEYVAIEDDRTTELCQSLHGTKRPKDDPFWDQFTPPNHYNCRSAKVELFDDDTATDVPDVKPTPGFGFNPGNVFRDSLQTEAA